MKQLLTLFLVLFFSELSAQTFEQYIQSSSDDAEEKFDGSYVTISSSDIELVYDSWNSQGLQTIGLRFADINIPANSVINNAYIQFTADGSYSGDVSINIKGESSNNSITFSNEETNISSRNTTLAEVSWTLTEPWSDNESGINQRTPDLSDIVSEVLALNGWQFGNAVSFILTGNGGSDAKRRAFSFNEDPSKSAKLVIEYTSLSDVDLAVTSIQQPNEYMYSTSSIPIKVDVKNFGNLTINNFEILYYIDNDLVATDTSQETLNPGQSSSFTFSQMADFSTLGTYTVKAEVNAINGIDSDSTNNTFTKTVHVISEVDTLFFSAGSAWSYFDSTFSSGSNWTSIEYNDSSWSIGMGHFGFGESDQQTEFNSGLAAYFLRKKVNISNLNQLNNVYMHLIHDDAAVVYINGQEAFRTELMPLGQINHTTTARQSGNSSNENEFYTYKLDTSLFVNGINVIAISLHNRSTSNSDLSFDCFITSDFQYSQDGPYVSYEGNTIIVEEVTTTGVVSNTYNSTSEIVLTCYLPHMSTSFSFPLKNQISIEPSEQDTTPSKFFSVSDFDGHIEAFTMLLKGEGIIDDEFKWIYGNGHLIISGDLFDRGHHVTECMWLLYKLEDEAKAQGGKVHLIIGNHEMFNLEDDWRYVEVKYFNNAHLMGKRMIELYDNNTELGRWLRSKNIIERIGDYAFMHGGISPEVSALNLTYNQMNEYGRLEMNGDCNNTDCDIVNGSDGVYWYRGMAEEELTQSQVDEFVTNLGVERVIIGHTKGSTVRSLYNGRVLAIDMYHMDNFENGFMEALQFKLGCFYIFHTENNEHTYTLIDECDDFDTTNILEVNTLGQLQVYPNPTVSQLNVILPQNLQDNYMYRIVNQNGNTIRTGQTDSESFSIGLNGVESGRYYLILKSSKREIMGNFILVK
ncbi:MAG: metallophosphoesterase [Flavobacteriales bacterium]|nr:metallophosphoesterase [Flavobacteriales bacterium]